MFAAATRALASLARWHPRRRRRLLLRLRLELGDPRAKLLLLDAQPKVLRTLFRELLLELAECGRVRLLESRRGPLGLPRAHTQVDRRLPPFVALGVRLARALVSESDVRRRTRLRVASCLLGATLHCGRAVRAQLVSATLAVVGAPSLREVAWRERAISGGRHADDAAIRPVLRTRGRPRLPRAARARGASGGDVDETNVASHTNLGRELVD